MQKINWEQEFEKSFQNLCRTKNRHDAWRDLMCAMACTISNRVDKFHFDDREQEFSSCIDRLGSLEIPAQMLTLITLALDENPNQDFLGSMYMRLNLANKHNGQFFTPYDVCRLMAAINIQQIENGLRKKGWESVNDSCAGGGSTLIAAANAFRAKGINYQQDILFVGQEIDRNVAMMAYIQLSLLGCSGYIVVGDALVNRVPKNILMPQINEGQEIWYTPMFFSQVWNVRRIFNLV